MSSYVDLLKACKEGNHKKVKKFLGVCKDICDVRDLTDKTLLHYCFKYELCADLILEAAPELLDVGEKFGYTVLHLASMMKPPTSLKYLLSKNPDINKRNNDLRSSLLLAVIYDNYEALKLLCEHNAEVNVSDISGVSPLHYAAKIKSTKPDENETRIMDLLFQYKANIESLDFYERSPLVWAVCSNNIIKMNYLIAKGANIYCKDAGGLSILHYATSNGNIEIIKVLLEQYSFDIEILDNNKCTALMYACSYNNPGVIEFLLEKGANVNAEDCKRRNGAHFASAKGDLKILQVLHQYNCNLWKLNYDSNYPLHEAAYKGHCQVLEFLIAKLDQMDNRINMINHKNSNGQTALHLATVKDNLEICSVLLKNGADPNIQLRVNNGKSMTALDLANKETTKHLIIEFKGQTSDNILKTSVISEEVTDSISEDVTDSEYEDETINSKTFNNLDSNEIASDNDVESKKEFESQEPEMETENIEAEKPLENTTEQEILEISEEYQKVLFTACYNGNVDEVQTFIRKGGSLRDLLDNSGKSLLHYSLKNKESFKLIIEKDPVLINQPDYSNLTILHMVIMSKQTDQLQLLLDHNADINFPDSNGRTSLHLAIIYDNLEALQIIHDHFQTKSDIQHKADVEGNYPLHYAVEVCKFKKTVCRCQEFMELLLNMNSDIECRDIVNRTPLLLAINIKNIEAVFILLKYGADIMARDNQNLCSIHYVCSEGSLNIFNQLAESHTFDPDIEDPNGLTPIFYAISSCNEKVVSRLIELQAKLDILDQHGRNICHKAAEKGAFKCLELLISHNVNPWLKSDDGTMPLHEAAYRGYKEIAEILLNTNSAEEFINDKNSSGQTALHLAAVRNDCPMCFLLISKGSNVNEPLQNAEGTEDLTAYDLATTTYCKDTLYTFGGRSAKKIVDCVISENESECNSYLEELAIIRIDNSVCIPRTSIRSTELALSTMASVINTVRTNEVIIEPKPLVTQPLSSPKKTESSIQKKSSNKSSESSIQKKSSNKSSENSIQKKSSNKSSESSFLNSLVNGEFDEVEIPAKESPTPLSDTTVTESRPKTISAKSSVKRMSKSDQMSEYSELSKLQKSIINSRNPSIIRSTSRTKSSRPNDRKSELYTIDRKIKDRIQNSVINYEYSRLNCRIVMNMAREKIRQENIDKLMDPKTPKVLKRTKRSKISSP